MKAPSVALFATKLKQVLEKQHAIENARTYVVDLSAVREELAGKWEKLGAKIESTAATVIRRRLADEDVVAKLDGPAFMIVFGALDPGEAEVKCALLSEEVRERIVGKHPSVGNGAVGAGFVNLERGTEATEIDLDASVARIAQSRPTLVVGADDPDDPSHRSRFPAKRDPAGQDEMFGQPAVRWRTRTGTVRGGRVPVPLDDDDGAADAPSADPLDTSNFRFHYRPMWDVSRGVVTTFHCVLDRVPETDADGEPVDGEASDSRIVDLDLAVLDHGLTDLRSMLETERRMLVSVPVHYATLGAPLRHRTRYVDRLRTVPDEARQLLLAEIVEVPSGALASRLLEIVEFIRPFLRSVMLRTDLDERDFSRLVGMRIFAAGVDVGGEVEDERDLIRAMQRFTKRAEGVGLRTYIRGLSSLSMTTAAICAGFDSVDGDAVASIVDAPEAMYRFEPLDLISNLTRSNAER